MRKLTLRKTELTDLRSDELRDVVAADPTPPRPPSMPVTGCVSRLHDESICACVSTGGTTR